MIFVQNLETFVQYLDNVDIVLDNVLYLDIIWVIFGHYSDEFGTSLNNSRWPDGCQSPFSLAVSVNESLLQSRPILFDFFLFNI